MSQPTDQPQPQQPPLPHATDASRQPPASDPAPPDHERPVDTVEGDDEESLAEQLELVSPEQAHTPRDYALWVGVLVLACLTVYGPALRGEFLWDDDRYVEQNVAMWRPDGLQNVWTAHPRWLLSDEAGRAEVQPYMPQYYPLTYTSFWLEYQLFGPAQGPPPPDAVTFRMVLHVTNVLLHAGGAVLLWFILRRLRVPGSWVIAAVFALHPLNVESVAWISERKNVLSGVFFFGAILAYLRFAEVGEEDLPAKRADDAPADADAEPDGPRWDMYGLALLLFVLGLLSKTVVAVVPAVILVLLWWKRRLDARHAGLLVPMFVLGLIMSWVTGTLETQFVGAQGAEWDLSIAQRIVLAGQAVWFYTYKLLVPVNLSFNYPRWEIDPSNVVQWVYPIAVLVVLGLLAALMARVGRGPLAAALIYVGTLAPALGFFTIYPQRFAWVADHFAYHASAAFIALVGGALALLVRRLTPEPAAAPVPEGEETPAGPEPARAPYVIASIVLLVLAAATWVRAGVFDNSISLWSDVIDKHRNSALAHKNLSAEMYELGLAYAGQGDEARALDAYESAIEHAATAAELRPDDAGAQINWGLALVASGQNQSGLERLDRAIELSPEEPAPYYHKGRILAELGRDAEALDLFRAAIELTTRRIGADAPGLAVYHELLADSLAATGQNEQAIAHYETAVQLNPSFYRAHKDLAAMYAMADRRNEAFEHYNIAITLNPQDYESWRALALLLGEVGRVRDATYAIGQALRINPEDPASRELAQRLIEWWQTQGGLATQPSSTQPGGGPATVPAARPDDLPELRLPAGMDPDHPPHDH